MLRRKQVLWGILATLVAPMPLWAIAQATPDEAKAMAIKAAAYLKQVGPETALPAFNAKTGPWQDRDLFVAVIDSKGVMVAHGSNPGLIGHNVLELKDIEGRPFNHEWVGIKDAGWVSFKWRNLQTSAIEPKTCYVIHVGDYFVGVGAYVK